MREPLNLWLAYTLGETNREKEFVAATDQLQALEYALDYFGNVACELRLIGVAKSNVEKGVLKCQIRSDYSDRPNSFDNPMQ